MSKNTGIEIALQAKQERVRRFREEKYRYYVPIGKVCEFLDKFGSNEYLVGVLSAANGIGKTATLANIVANICYEPNKEWFKGPLFTDYPYPEKKRGRIISDPTTVKTTIIPALKEWLPKGRYTTKNKGKQYEYEWTTDTGHVFDVMTYDQSLKEFESTNLGWVLCDEPPPRLIYKASVARTRGKGFVGIFMTPLDGSAWVYDDIITNQNNEEGYRFFTTATVEDACELHGVNGFLEHEAIEKMVAQYDDEDMQARVFGKFQHLMGLVFKNFKRDIHVIKPFSLKKEDWTTVVALDTHPRNPDAVLFASRDRKDRWVIHDEIYDNMNVGELAKRMRDKEANYRVVKRLIDPSAYNDDQHFDDRSVGHALQYEYGMRFEKGSKKRMDAIQLTKDAFNYTEVKGDIIVPPQLYIMESCTRLIWELEHYQWQEWRGKTQEYKSPNEKPVDKDDHLIEDLGRIIIDNQKFVEPTWGPKREPTEVKDDPYE